MKKPEDLPDQRYNVLSISGSDRGVFILMMGETKQIIDMLRFAVRKRPVLREILEHSLKGERTKNERSGEGECC